MKTARELTEMLCACGVLLRRQISDVTKLVEIAQQDTRKEALEEVIAICQRRRDDHAEQTTQRVAIDWELENLIEEIQMRMGQGSSPTNHGAK